jgi:hypothetical protein
MKYALWRMLTRVGRVLSLRARQALNAALKSGRKSHGKYAQKVVTKRFMSRVSNSTFCNHPQLERQHVTQQLCPARYITQIDC